MTEELPGEKPEDQDDGQYEDFDVNVAVVDELREENAARLREMLGLPEPKRGLEDLEVEFVQMYLTYCADFGVIDETHGPGHEYDHDDALWDLEVLRAAVTKVENSVKAAQKRPKKREPRPGRKAPKVSEDTRETLLDLQTRMKEAGTEDEPRAETIIIRTEVKRP